MSVPAAKVLCKYFNFGNLIDIARNWDVAKNVVAHPVYNETVLGFQFLPEGYLATITLDVHEEEPSVWVDNC
jgi:hypothetical protein